jgi:hypothetical protein
MSNIPSFPKVWNLGHDAIQNLFIGTVEITEKVDGSLFGWGIDINGDVVMRSKSVELFTKEQNGMFALAIDQVEKRTEKLLDFAHKVFQAPIFIYSEYLSRPKHNCIAYSRVPKDNLIIFGARIGYHWISKHSELKELADLLELEVVPLLYYGEIKNDRVAKSEFGNPDQAKKFGYTAYEKLKAMIMSTESLLGNSLVEGVVIKNYGQLCSLGNVNDPCFGKYVREEFKEKLHKEWDKISGKNALPEFISGFKTAARWQKAVQHLREKGELENSPRDIGKLMKEVHIDIEAEEETVIKKFLYNYYIKDIKRVASAGLPEWWKDQLLKKQCREDS